MAMIVHASSAPRSAWPGIRKTTCSNAQIASNPASSARFVKLLMNEYGSGVLEWLPMGKTRPIFNWALHRVVTRQMVWHGATVGSGDR